MQWDGSHRKVLIERPEVFRRYRKEHRREVLAAEAVGLIGKARRLAHGGGDEVFRRAVSAWSSPPACADRLTAAQYAETLQAYCAALESRSMRRVSFILAAAAAEQLGGAEAVGRVVRSDTDMAMAVDMGFKVDAIDALRERGVTDREIGDLIIKPRTLSHRRANRSKLTVEESDRAARVARAFALAEKTFANRDKAERWLHKSLNSFGGRTPMELIRTDAGARIVENLMARISWGAPA